MNEGTRDEGDPRETAGVLNQSKIQPGQTKSDQIRPNPTKSDQIRPNPTKSDQIRPLAPKKVRKKVEIYPGLNLFWRVSLPGTIPSVIFPP